MTARGCRQPARASHAGPGANNRIPPAQSAALRSDMGKRVLLLVVFLTTATLVPGEKSRAVRVHEEKRETEKKGAEESSQEEKVVPVKNPHSRKAYRFGYEVLDKHNGHQFRQETQDSSGAIHGSYGFQQPHGLYRLVHYIADTKGFRVVVSSNEPGISRQRPANVDYIINRDRPALTPSGDTSTHSLHPPSPPGTPENRYRQEAPVRHRPQHSSDSSFQQENAHPNTGPPLYRSLPERQTHLPPPHSPPPLPLHPHHPQYYPPEGVPPPDLPPRIRHPSRNIPFHDSPPRQYPSENLPPHFPPNDHPREGLPEPDVFPRPHPPPLSFPHPGELPRSPSVSPPQNSSPLDQDPRIPNHLSPPLLPPQDVPHPASLHPNGPPPGVSENIYPIPNLPYIPPNSDAAPSYSPNPGSPEPNPDVLLEEPPPPPLEAEHHGGYDRPSTVPLAHPGGPPLPPQEQYPAPHLGAPPARSFLIKFNQNISPGVYHATPQGTDPPPPPTPPPPPPPLVDAEVLPQSKHITGPIPQPLRLGRGPELPSSQPEVRILPPPLRRVVITRTRAPPEYYNDQFGPYPPYDFQEDPVNYISPSQNVPTREEYSRPDSQSVANQASLFNAQPQKNPVESPRQYTTDGRQFYTQVKGNEHSVQENERSSFIQGHPPSLLRENAVPVQVPRHPSTLRRTPFQNGPSAVPPSSYAYASSQRSEPERNVYTLPKDSHSLPTHNQQSNDDEKTFDYLDNHRKSQALHPPVPPRPSPPSKPIVLYDNQGRRIPPHAVSFHLPIYFQNNAGRLTFPDSPSRHREIPQNYNTHRADIPHCDLKGSDSQYISRGNW